MVVAAVGGCSVEVGRTLDVQVVAGHRHPRPEGTETVGDPGDPVRFLVAELARSADDGRATSLRGGEAEDRDLIDRGGDIGRAEVDRRQGG